MIYSHEKALLRNGVVPGTLPTLCAINIMSSYSLVPRPSSLPVFDRLQYTQEVKNWRRGRTGNDVRRIVHDQPIYSSFGLHKQQACRVYGVKSYGIYTLDCSAECIGLQLATCS